MFPLRQITYSAAIIVAMTALSACSEKASPPAPVQQTGSLTRTFSMVDTDNRVYGKVEMTPLGVGLVYDAQGQVIGKIVPTGMSHHRHDDEDDNR